jgi:hypothetical protein
LAAGSRASKGIAAALMVALVAIAAPRAAWAQATAGTVASGATARDHLKAGDKAAKAGDWARALEEYSAANALQPSAEALQGVGDAQDKLGNTPRAYEAYDDLLKTYARNLSQRTRSRIEKRLAELASVTGALSIRVNEDGATVQMDGAVLGMTPVRQLMRVTSGAHQLRVSKEGFTPFDQAISVPPDGKVVVTVELKQEAQTGKLVVREKSGRALRVLLDGVDVGAAPYTGDLAPKSYEVSGRGTGLMAPPKIVSVEKGKTLEVELEAVVSTARVEVHTSDNVGTIFLDGSKVGEGSFAGDVPPGEHRIRVERAGYLPYEKTVTLAQQQVLAESVTLQQQVDGLGAASGARGTRIRDGVYGGFQLGMALMPWGASTTMDRRCETLGATSCDTSNPKGALAAGYVGYALDPIGFEVFAGALADLARPTVTFDGVHGSDINPLVAAPARDEEFTIFRAGGLGAARVRGRFELTPSLQASAALGVGFSWRKMWMRRSSTATDGSGLQEEFIPDPKSYFSPGVSIDVSAGWMLGETTALTAGVWFWGETAKENARTAAETDRFMTSKAQGVMSKPIATPAYDLANGAQLYLGPYVGMQFGP